VRWRERGALLLKTSDFRLDFNEERGTDSNEGRGRLRLPDEERENCSQITSTRNEGELPYGRRRTRDEGPADASGVELIASVAR